MSLLPVSADPADLELAQAVACHDRNDRPQAMRGYRRAAALSPWRVDAVGSVGLVATEIGDPAAARWLRRALAIDPESVPAHHNLALVPHDQDERERGRVLRRLLTLAPAHVEGGRLLARLVTDLGNLSSAQIRLARALAADPRSAPAWVA